MARVIAFLTLAILVASIGAAFVAEPSASGAHTLDLKLPGLDSAAATESS